MNALRVALRIISGKNIYNFAILENLRIFQNCLFTGGVVTASGICSAAFCESAALRKSFLALSGANAPDSPFCRCATSSPGAGEVFPQGESPWHSGTVSG